MGIGGDFRAVLLALVNEVVALLIYLQFIKIYNNKLLKEESENY